MTNPARQLGNVFFHDLRQAGVDEREALLAGLQSPQKTVDPKWFYDAAGSALFERITELPEYYPTRTEIDILRDNREAISRCCGRGCVFIEPGSGNCEKARLLLNALRPAAYVPLDISADFLRNAARQLGHDYPWLTIHAVCADFNRRWPPWEMLPEGRRVVFYPGSTIGNLEPTAAAALLKRMAALIGAGGGLLIGVDLHKSSERLHAAYNDSHGITAQFNLNLLSRLNCEMDADFDERLFRHHAFYNQRQRRIEMHLVSEREQTVQVLGQPITFARGESIHTENSYKYTVEDFSSLAATAGFQLCRSWLDSRELFSVHYLETAPD